MTFEKIRAVCLHNVYSVYVMYAVLGERWSSMKSELVSKIKEKMTKGISSKQTVAVQTAFGEMWKMCSEARSSSFGYQLTISFV